MALAAGHKEHIQPVSLQVLYLAEDLTRPLNTGFSSLISPDMVAVADRTGDKIDPIRSLLKGFKQITYICLSRAGHANKFHISRILYF